MASDAAVWAFCTEPEDFLDDSTRADSSPLDVSRTRLFEARHFDRRLSAQQGLFSIHKWWKQGEKVVPLDGHSELQTRLHCLSIPKEFLTKLTRQLVQVGISAASVYPDLEGLCKHLSVQHRLQPIIYFMSAKDGIGLSATTTDVRLHTQKDQQS